MSAIENLSSLSFGADSESDGVAERNDKNDGTRVSEVTLRSLWKVT